MSPLTVVPIRPSNNVLSVRVSTTTKEYWLIFPPKGPAAITESWKAAEYWKKQGCEVERYLRTTKQ